MGSVQRIPHQMCLRTRTFFSCALASRPTRFLGSDGEFVPSKKADLYPCSIHIHPFMSSRSTLQLARILSMILLTKFSCAVHATETGLAAEAPPSHRLSAQRLQQGERLCSRTNINFQGIFTCAVSTILVSMMQLLLLSPRSTMRRS